MPSGKTHRLATTFLLGAMVPIVVISTESWPVLLGVGATLVVNPDLDLVENRKNSFLKMYWYPYGKLISHRSKFSHSLVASTVIRFIYGFWLPILALHFLFKIGFEFWFPFLVGMMVSDALHIIMDKTTTYFRRRF